MNIVKKIKHWYYSRKLEILIDKARHRPPMDQSERDAQRESWARGEIGMGSDADEARYRAKHCTTERLRGHRIYHDGEQFRYLDNDEPTKTGRLKRHCGHCGKLTPKSGHDPCIENLPDVVNACCGHGDVDHAYVMFDNGDRIGGMKAIKWMERNK